MMLHDKMNDKMNHNKHDNMNDNKNDSDNDNHNDNDGRVKGCERMKQTSKVPRVPPSRVFAAHAPVQWMYPTYVCTSGHFTELLKMVIYTGFSIDIHTHIKMTIFNSYLVNFLGKQS